MTTANPTIGEAITEHARRIADQLEGLTRYERTRALREAETLLEHRPESKPLGLGIHRSKTSDTTHARPRSLSTTLCGIEVSRTSTFVERPSKGQADLITCKRCRRSPDFRLAVA